MVLDDDGHGSGSASVSAGNRYGYCPTCLLFVVEALDESVVNDKNWIDISTHSFGEVGGVPIGLATGGSKSARDAVERGQTVLFAAGNGVGNAFDVPQVTWGGDGVGPDWTITVGAIRRDNQRAVIGDGIPAHISAWGDGNLPSACRTGTVGQCAFGGTSAATPYTAGIFGTVLTEAQPRDRRRGGRPEARPGRRAGSSDRPERLPRGRQADPHRAAGGGPEDGHAAQPAQRRLAVPVPADGTVPRRGERALRGLRRSDARTARSARSTSCSATRRCPPASSRTASSRSTGRSATRSTAATTATVTATWRATRSPA